MQLYAFVLLINSTIDALGTHHAYLCGIGLSRSGNILCLCVKSEKDVVQFGQMKRITSISLLFQGHAGFLTGSSRSCVHKSGDSLRVNTSQVICMQFFTRKKKSGVEYGKHVFCNLVFSYMHSQHAILFFFYFRRVYKNTFVILCHTWTVVQARQYP